MRIRGYMSISWRCKETPNPYPSPARGKGVVTSSNYRFRDNGAIEYTIKLPFSVMRKGVLFYAILVFDSSVIRNTIHSLPPSGGRAGVRGFILPPSYKYMYECISVLDEEPLKGTPYGLESQDTSETQER